MRICYNPLSSKLLPRPCDLLAIKIESFNFLLLVLAKYLKFLFYQIELSKNGVTLILPSSIARNSSAPIAKIIFEILWGILEGRTNSERPSGPVWKIAKMALFNPCM